MKIVITLIMCLIVTTTAFANTAKCYLPKDCTYLDSEFSTAGGDKSSYLMEVTCKMKDNTIVKYIHWKLSIGSMFGVGRFTAPKKILFIPSNNKELKCSY
jgi:hypothetical protein